jgi:LPS-assembly protein
MLEPVAQVSWTGGSRLDIPNEESTLVEFDQGNLLSMSRFPRADRRERGAMAALGLGWSRFSPTGWDAQLSMGQVFREDSETDFTVSSGLNGLSSDFLVAGQISSGEGVTLTGRSLLDDDLTISKAELRGAFAFEHGSIGGSYVWLEEDFEETRARDVSEVTLDGSFDINPFWTASANWRYDVSADRAAIAGLGLRYENECVTLNLSVKRRYTTSTSVEPSTDFGFNVGLRGFSADTGTERYVRSCSN